MDIHPSQCLKKSHTLNDLNIDAIPWDKRNFVTRIINSRDFIECSTEREQVFTLYKAAKDNEIQLGIRPIAEFFGVSKSAIQKHLMQANKNPEETPIGRPPLLSHEEHTEVLKYVLQGIEQHYPRNYLAIRNFIYNVYNRTLELDSIRHYIKNSLDFKVVKGTPLQSSRSFSSEQKINEYFSDLKELLSIRIPSRFVFNIDEVGFNEYLDAKQTKCIVPQNYKGNSIFFAADRNSSHSTMLAGIAADGSALTPLMIVERDTFELELYNMGYTSDKLMLAHSDSGFINERLFLKWAKDIFYQEIRQKRNICSYADPAVLILDNLHAHMSEEFVTECQDVENIY